MRSTFFKVIAFILCVICVITVPISVLGVYCMVQNDFYTRSEESILFDEISYPIYNKAHTCMDTVEFGEPHDTKWNDYTGEDVPKVRDDVKIYSSKDSTLRFELLDKNGKLIAKSEQAKDEKPQPFTYTLYGVPRYVVWSEENSNDFYIVGEDTPSMGLKKEHREYNGCDIDDIEPEEPHYTFRAYLIKDTSIHDEYGLIAYAVHLAYTLRYAVFFIGGGALIAAILLFIYLMCVSGRRNGSDELHPGALYRVPFDVLLAADALIVYLFLRLETVRYQYPTVVQICILAGFAVTVMSLILGLCMSAAARIKGHTLFRNTILGIVIRLIIKVCRKIPIIWRTLLILGIYLPLDGIVSLMLISERKWEIYFALWFVSKIVFCAVVIYTAVSLRKLQKSGEKLAAGDLSYHTDNTFLIADFRKHADNLNAVSDGMSRAVAERMKSERMKTELITNVSHDIKTPLTSIINYSELIGKEPSDAEKVTQYADVLHRHSERLKRLIDDLVEASKASSGAIDILLAPCDAGVMLTQASGEFEEKLSARDLETVVSVPEEPVMILADNRRLWRVVDNLMSNIAKYAQSGTRVYLSLAAKENRAVMTLANISAAPLNISPDELMERFVRGDLARTTDGNGLGLSIAKSLTELQNGTFDIAVDADLFKVTLTFPRARDEEITRDYEGVCSFLERKEPKELK